MALNSRTTPKRAVVKPWPFGFRVSEGHLKLDLAAGDPPALTFVNRTDFEVQFHFDTPFLGNPIGGGPPPGSGRPGPASHRRAACSRTRRACTSTRRA